MGTVTPIPSSQAACWSSPRNLRLHEATDTELVRELIIRNTNRSPSAELVEGLTETVTDMIVGTVQLS